MIGCPQLDEYQQLLQGYGQTLEVEILARHLEGCPYCGDTVEHLLSQNTLSEVVRAQEPFVCHAEREAVTELIQRLRGLTRLSPSFTQASAPITAAELHDFLSPPQAADE